MIPEYLVLPVGMRNTGHCWHRDARGPGLTRRKRIVLPLTAQRPGALLTGVPVAAGGFPHVAVDSCVGSWLHVRARRHGLESGAQCEGRMSSISYMALWARLRCARIDGTCAHPSQGRATRRPCNLTRASGASKSGQIQPIRPLGKCMRYPEARTPLSLQSSRSVRRRCRQRRRDVTYNMQHHAE
jgi:hypothetical protein